MVETDRLTKRYGAAREIDDVSITVERGEVCGFLCPNGAGKTTTIQTLLDLLHPTSGRALIFGLDSHLASRKIRARLGNLPGTLRAIRGSPDASPWSSAPMRAGCAAWGLGPYWRSGSRPISTGG